MPTDAMHSEIPTHTYRLAEEELCTFRSDHRINQIGNDL